MPLATSWAFLLCWGFYSGPQVQCRVGVWFLKDRGHIVLPLEKQDTGLQFGKEHVALDALR